MLTIYSEQDLIAAMREAAEKRYRHEGLLLEKLVFCKEAFYKGGSASCHVSL